MKLRQLLPGIALCGSLAVTSAFGQSTFTWTNASGGNLATATSWNPNGVPSPTVGSNPWGDTMLFNGTAPGPIMAVSTTGQVGFSGSDWGLHLVMSSGQTSPLTIFTTVSGVASSGIRFHDITIDAGAGQFQMGVNSTTNCLDTLWGGSNPSQQGLTNNSSFPAIICPDVRWRYGGGGAHTMVFGGTGDWRITNSLVNVNGAATLIQKDGSGTMYWNAGQNAFWGTLTVISTPMTISGGTLVLQSSSLFPSGTTINTSAGAKLILDVTGGSQTIANPVNGGGDIQVNNGTLTLSGANTFTGSTILNGGSLVANRAENLGVNGPLGVGGSISFNGGTLVFSSVNSYDYSPRFTTAAAQSFRFDTAGQNVTLTNVIASTGGTLTKLGSGTLTISGANTYDGATTVSAGKLVIQGTQGNGAITVANSAALGAYQGGQQITPSSLTVGTSSSATLEFNNVNNTTTAAIATTGGVSAGGTITVNVNSGSFTIGSSYPLFSWGSGSAPAVSLGTLVGAVGNLSTNGSTIQLNVTGLAYVWRGVTDGNWDTTTANNWLQNASPALWANGSAALFDDTVTGETNVVLNAPITAASVTVNNNSAIYTMTSSGANVLGGSGGLTKSGSSSLTVAGGLNTFSGATTVNGGVLSVGALADGGSASDIGASSSAAASLVLNGGTLRYTGAGATINRQFSLGTAGGTIDNQGGGALVLNNTGATALSGSGARTLTLTGNGSDEIAASLSDSGGATALTKSGTGTWTVTANNTISGAVTVNGGTLQIGNGGASGSVGSGAVSINPAGTIVSYNRSSGTVTNGTVSGTGSLSVNGGVKVVLPNNNTYSGGTTIDNASTLQVGVGGATGQLSPNAPITVDGTLDFNTSGTFAYGGTGIAGGGNVIVRGGGKITSLGANSYTGWTLIQPGSTFQPCQGNQGALASSAVTNNGTLLLIRQDTGVFIYSGPITGTGKVLVDANNFNAGNVTLTGNCDYTGGTFIGDNGLVIGDGTVNGWITGNVIFQNSTQVPDDNARTITFNRSDDVVFPGNLVTNFTSAQVNQGALVQNGTGKLTLTGINTYGSGTTVNAGILHINGTNYGPSGVTVNAGGTLGGTGVIVASVTVNVGGVLAPGASIGTLSISNNLNIAGDLLIEVNKAAGQTSDRAHVGGTINNTGVGTLLVTNLGPSLSVGDTFTIFDKPVVNGAALTVTGGGATSWINNLAVDGTITVSGPTLSVIQSGSNLDFSWVAAGFKLQSKTNSLGVGLSGGTWVDVPGGATSPISVPIDPAQGTVFFRLSN